MSIFLAIFVAVVLNLLIGALLYGLITALIPDTLKDKFYKLVPLYPKTKYAITLYTIASILYLLLNRGISLVSPFISLFCIILSSQIVRGIAKLSNESLEETFEEEIERKRKSLE